MTGTGDPDVPGFIPCEPADHAPHGGEDNPSPLPARLADFLDVPAAYYRKDTPPCPP